MKIKREFLICTAIFVLMASLPLFAIGASYGLEEPVNTDTSGVLSKVESSKSESKTEKAPSKTESKATSSEAKASESSQESLIEVSNSDKISADGRFKILDTSTNEVLTLTDEEFLIGAVAAEMPPSYETEALKAQCVAAYTCYAKKELMRETILTKN